MKKVFIGRSSNPPRPSFTFTRTRTCVLHAACVSHVCTMSSPKQRRVIPLRMRQLCGSVGGDLSQDQIDPALRFNTNVTIKENVQ